ncbi:MAG: hypothetical protein ACTSRZ_00110 [Promethearchaeota archaeon]
MRRSIKIIALIATIVIFILLDALMYLIDWIFEEASSTIALISLFILIGFFIGVGIFIFIRKRQKIKFK